MSNKRERTSPIETRSSTRQKLQTSNKRERTSPNESSSSTRQKQQKTPEENSKFFFSTFDVGDLERINIASLKYILDSINKGDEYDLNYNVRGTTLLSCAARFAAYSHHYKKNDKKQILIEIVNKLLDIDKDHVMVGIENSQKETPLMFACYSKETALAMKIIDTGRSNPNMQDVKGRTALTACCKNGLWEVCDKLLTVVEKKTIGLPDNNGVTPLMHTIADYMAENINDFNKKYELCLKLIDTGYSNPNMQDVKGRTAFTVCCINGLWSIGEKLFTVVNKETIGLPDNNGVTPLMHAAAAVSVGETIEIFNKKQEFCLNIIDTGHSNPNMQDIKGHTALTECCINGMWTVCDKLLTVVNKEIIGLPDNKGITPLMHAIDSVSYTEEAHNAKDVFCVNLIDTGYSNPSQIDNAREQTALILSVEYNTIKTSLKLLELANEGVDVAINANLKFIGNNTITTTAVHNLLLKIFTLLRTQRSVKSQAAILREFIYYYLTHRDTNNPAEIHWVISEDIIKNICKEKIFASKLKNYLFQDKRIKDIPNVDWDGMCNVIPTVAKIKSSPINMQTASFTNDSPILTDDATEIPVLQGINIPTVAYYVDMHNPDTGEMVRLPVYDRDLVDPTISGTHIPRPKDPYYTGRDWEEPIIGGGRTKKNKNKRTKRNKQSKRIKRKTRKA